MKIIKNNYVPEIVSVKHKGYRHICTKCESELIVEEKDTYRDDFWQVRMYTCPCCKNEQRFFKTRIGQVEWSENELKK